MADESNVVCGFEPACSTHAGTINSRLSGMPLYLRSSPAVSQVFIAVDSLTGLQVGTLLLWITSHGGLSDLVLPVTCRTVVGDCLLQINYQSGVPLNSPGIRSGRLRFLLWASHNALTRRSTRLL
jgi:hypothetical protein